MLRPTTPPGAPVRNLQTMLRTISMAHPAIPRLLPDGIFGERTLEAVMLFQRNFHPPVTGKVDNSTWDAMTKLYFEVLAHLESPSPSTGYPGRDYVVAPGDRCVHLYLIQAMFKALDRILEELEDGPVNGIHEGASVRNICYIQKKGQLEGTGILDSTTWEVLTRLYTIFVTYAQTSWLSRPEVLTAKMP